MVGERSAVTNEDMEKFTYMEQASLYNTCGIRVSYRIMGL